MEKIQTQKNREIVERKGDNMIKSLGIIIGGIFIGAMGMEIIRKKYPKALNNSYKKARKITSGTKEVCRQVKEAFKAGYENATPPQKAAPAGT